MTVFESLKGISRYPVPQSTFDKVAVKRGLTLSAELTQNIVLSKNYRLAESDVMTFISTAPDITEGDVKFSMSKTEREALMNMANAIIDSSSGSGSSNTYGYQGENF